jgi:hypothetical protein
MRTLVLAATVIAAMACGQADAQIFYSSGYVGPVIGPRPFLYSPTYIAPRPFLYSPIYAAPVVSPAYYGPTFSDSSYFAPVSYTAPVYAAPVYSAPIVTGYYGAAYAPVTYRSTLRVGPWGGARYRVRAVGW